MTHPMNRREALRTTTVVVGGLLLTSNGLVLGFAPIRPENADDGMRRLADAIDAARSRPGRRAPTTGRLVRA